MSNKYLTMIVHGLSLLVRMLRFKANRVRKLWWCEWILSMSWREMDGSLGGNGWRVCTPPCSWFGHCTYFVYA